jgi:probable HAF family extracellular repeat protein
MKPLFISRRKTGVRTDLIIVLLVAIAELFPAEHSLSQPPAYTVLEVSGASGAREVFCRINNLGDLVGRAGNVGGGGTGAAIWSHGSLKRKQLGFLAGGDYSSGFAINDEGEVAGGSNAGNAIVPFFWKTMGGFQRIPLLRGDNCGQAFSINRYGHAAGYSSGPNGARAFFWTKTTGVRNLGTLLGGGSSRAYAVNDSDDVAGVSGSPAGDHAVLWTKTGQIRDLGTLPGGTSSEAVAINNTADVVGYSKGPGGQRAFLWTKANGMHDLGVLPGGNVSRAVDINDAGEVVGMSASSGGDHAFIWTKQEGMSDLNNAASAGLAVLLVEAHAINNKGQILAMGKAGPESSAGGGSAPEPDHCAPAPPSTFLLIPR